MNWTLEGAVAVVVAHRFNLTAANQYWLVKERIVPEGDFQEGTIFTDAVVQIRTTRFHMLLLPEQLQFVPNVAVEDEQELMNKTLGGLVSKLPHVPYKGMGLNFNWHLTPPDGDTNRLTRELFYVADRPLFRAFSDDNARYGGYLSRDFEGFRMKLDVKPVVFPGENGPEHRVQFAFNFHRDFGPEPAAEIVARLARWDDLRAETERVIDSVESR